MDEKIVLILNEMSEYLSIAQMKKLQEVILKTLSENEAEKVEISNEDFLKMFLDAKRIEGCADRTIKYYRVTVEHLLARPNAEQIHFIEQVVDYVVENGYINNILDLMKAPFDRPYKFSVIFTRDEQIKFVQVINSIKNNALIA